jgi:EAL domain-containing protein (putative c-di-GMP-specific phosphodiesterase class I)
MNQRAVEFLALEHDLRRALDEREFWLQYQPIVDIASGEAVGAEALIRWRRADGSVVGPAQFIPVAEESGLIVPIGRWVLAAAARQAGKWNRGRRTPFYVSINLSARQFRDPGLVGAVRSAIESTGLDPALIKLEITESTVMQNAEDAARMLAALKALGVKLSVDDFGTGYSSLAYLKRFPIDTIKIDRSFIQGLPGDSDDATLTQAIIAMAHSLRLKTVAEGVETPEQLEFLRKHGCDEIQGYYFSQPLPFAALLDMLREHRARPSAQIAARAPSIAVWP